MDESAKWLMHNLSGSDSIEDLAMQNWLWVPHGLGVVFIVIV